MRRAIEDFLAARRARCMALLLRGAAWLINAGVPRRGLLVERALAFGPAPRQRLDLYRPAGQGGPLPVILFLYGGGWNKGSRADYLFIAEPLARAGFLVAVADYRLWPEASFPAFVEDAARALAWLKGGVGERGGDPDRVLLLGHSAGAYNALLLALDRRFLAAEGLATGAITAVMGLAGPYAFNPLDHASTRPVFDVGRPPEELRPVSFASQTAPPALLLHGLDDTTVYPLNTEALAAALGAAGATVETRLYPRLGHFGIVLAFARGFRRKAPVLDDLLAFARRMAG
jgi:acetyl esterase/lipase